MTRKDFELIAKTIAYSRLDDEGKRHAADAFATVLGANYPRFDAERFTRMAATPPNQEWQT